MQYARQISLDDEVETMLDDQQMMKLRGWLRQPGVGVAVFTDGEVKHLITYGNRTARIPNRWPPSHYGAWEIFGFLPAGTTVPKANEGLSRLGPPADGTLA